MLVSLEMETISLKTLKQTLLKLKKEFLVLINPKKHQIQQSKAELQRVTILNLISLFTAKQLKTNLGQMKLNKTKVLAIQTVKVPVVVGDNVDALQDSVNYGEQTQFGATDTIQDQNNETETTQLAVVDSDNTTAEQYSLQ